MSRENKITSESEIEKVLTQIFPIKHAKSAIKHLKELKLRYKQGDWEKCLLRVGKFVEAVLKNIYVYCGKTLPRQRRFNVGKICRELENLGPQYDDNIRIIIPKACIFIYDITSNRGARHDCDEIDPNELDASVSVEVASWILAELIRFADASSTDPNKAKELVIEVAKEKIMSFGEIFEDADGKGYINSINIKNISAEKTGLFLLLGNYPKFLPREMLVDFIVKNGHSKNNAGVALSRLKKLIYTDENNNIKLRGIGRQEAKEQLLKHMSI